jgi:hypothetical protein
MVSGFAFNVKFLDEDGVIMGKEFKEFINLSMKLQ